ncbi:MAG TPA: S53 family peptidase [Terriglobia bacterium]
MAGANVVCQAAQPQPPLTRHVREVTLNGEAQSVGRLPAQQSMRIDIVLALRDQGALESFLRELYDPSSRSYRQFLSVPEFTEMFGPSQKDYDAVISFAKANGFAVVGGSRDGMNVQLAGSVATIERAFHVIMGVYQHPTENRTFYAPDREPTVDLPFQLWHISGLDNYSIPKPALVRRNAGVQPLATTGSCPSASFCGSDMRAAYYGGTLTGTGQNIGLFEYAGFDIADVNAYYKNAGQTRTAAVTGISVDGTSVTCLASGGCDDTEQTIDITQALGMAPGVTTVNVYVGSGDPLDDSGILAAMSSDTPLPLNLSCSWGWTPADPSTDDPYYEKMAAQGQSFFVAAGDHKEWTKSNFPYPSEDANVITVGGTLLTTTGAGGPWASEIVWNQDGDGTGGGISPDKIPIPSWQQLTGVITTANKGSTVYRNGPDVSGNAAFSFYVCADQTTCTANDYGGTSFAAPMWAGYLALANEQAVTNGDVPPGFINPTIYPLALGSTYSTLFHDTTSGTNGFPAVTGYDLATGWGSPNGAGLINALAGASSPSFSLNANPNAITVARGSSGTSTITATIEGGFDSTITLSPSNNIVKFNPNPIAGPGSGTSTMTFTAPNNAPLGHLTLTITGKGGGITQTTKVTVTIVQ